MRLPAILALFAVALPALADPTCQARSGTTSPIVVELYTSEGCSSCPPADRWLSTLKGRTDLLPIAFHVDYWDRLGWPDRFASAEATRRQYALAQAMGSASVYTPQVIVDGQDWRRWPDLPRTAAASTLALALTREGDQVTVSIGSATGRDRLAGYWAVIEDKHVSRVSAGENRGETLRHDHIVRLYQPVAPWSAAHAQRFTLPVLAGVPEHPRRVAFVVFDPATQRPVQALSLAC